MNDRTPPRQGGGLAELRERAEERGFSFTGAAVLAFGTVLVLFAFVIPDWYRPGPGLLANADGNSSFGDVGSTLDALHDQLVTQGVVQYYSFGVAGPYFAWLGWTLLLFSLATGALAVSPIGQRHGSLRWLAAVVAFASVALTVQALDLVSVAGTPPKNAALPSWGEFVRHSSLGAWAAGLGFLVMMAASFIRRR